jgi:glutamine---fructose-6-phosphate transaminase (isomerizing)
VNPAGFRDDVLSAPDRLARTLDAYSGTRSPLSELPASPERVLFLGMGSSHFAALTAAAHLRSRGVDAVAELASTGLPAAPRTGTLVVAVSASGTTPETVEALERHRGAGTTVAVTNHPGSDLERVADLALPLASGEETGGVACVSFQATLAVLLGLCGTLTGAPAIDDLRPAVEAAAALRDRRQAWLPPVLAQLDGADTIAVIAPAERISSALQGALMLREGPRRTAIGCETGDWLHVDVYLTVHPGYRALLCAGSRFDAGVLEWAAKRGVPVVSVGEMLPGAATAIEYPGADDPLVATLVEVAVAELLAAELWLGGTPPA